MRQKNTFKLQRLFARLVRKDAKSRTGPMQPRNVPFSSPKTVRRGNRVARIKRWLVSRETQGHQGFKPVRNKTKTKNRLVGLLVLASFCAVFVYFDGPAKVGEKVLAVSLFQIDSIQITGNSIVSNDAIRDAAGIVVHQTSMLEVNKSEIIKQLAEVSWIAEAEVKKNWPAAVEIIVKENTPLALVDHGKSKKHQLYYIDKHGVSFLPVKPGGAVDFPVITGLPLVKDNEVRGESLDKALTFLQKVRRNDPHLPAHSVSEVHVNSEGELVVYLVEHPFPIFFGSADTVQNYGRLVEVLKALYKNEKSGQLISKIEYIQMDYQQDKVLVAQDGSG